jgi:hypothetical protein
MAEQAVKKSPWAKFGKALHIIVVGAFFLPFFGVSCSDKDMPGESIDIITFSGADMAMGCEPGGLISEAKNSPEMGGGGMGLGMDDMKIDKVSIEPLAIIALLLAVAGVLVAFLAKGRQAVMGSLITSVLCLGTVVGIWIKVGGDIKEGIAAQMSKDMDKSSMTRDAKVESGGRMGLWISLACLASCAALAGLALRDRNTMPDVVPPGGPDPMV